MILPLVSRINHSLEPPALLRDRLLLQPSPPLRPHRGNISLHPRPIHRARLNDLTPNQIQTHIRQQNPPRAHRSRFNRHQHAGNPAFLRHRHRVQRPRAAIGEQRKRPHIMPLLRRHRPYRSAHVRNSDPDDPECGLLHRQPQRIGDASPDRLPRRLFIHRHAPVQQRHRIQPVQHQVGIRQRRLRPTPAIGNRPRISPRTPRPHLQSPRVIQPGDGPATRPNHMHIHHRRADRILRHQPLGRKSRAPVLDQRDIGAGSARVERNDIHLSRRPSNFRRPHNARGRPGQAGADREPPHGFHRHQPAIRMHRIGRRRDTQSGQPFQKPIEIPFHPRPDRRVDRGGGKPLELPKLRQHAG